MDIVKLTQSPFEILNDPLLNKGSAFSEEERNELNLNGFLPYHVSTMEEQLKRRYENFCELPSRLAKYSFLSTLQNRNEILYFRFILDHVEEMLPLIYTPTVGDVSIHFSLLYNQHRGIYISFPLRDQMETIIASIPFDDIEVVVVTDGERILGLGDWGAGGMAISIGKLALYTLFGGIHPSKVLPVMLDTGTNNPELTKDPFYLGWRHERVRGEEYDDFIDQFITLIKKRYPHVLLQWEDFGKINAQKLLDRYRDTLCSFNDDIQGTAAVVLAAVYAAVKYKKSSLAQQKIAILGAGSAGVGICNQLAKAMMQEGVSEEEAKKRFFIIDQNGLIHSESLNISPNQKEFAQEKKNLDDWNVKNPGKINLYDVIINARPTVLIGVSTQAGAFTEEIVSTMAQYLEQPVILPLSNPKSCSEATPAEIFEWTKGTALIATGSPFGTIEYEGKQYEIGQCNNVYIFPGVGLGAIAGEITKITDEMMIKAAEILSSYAPILEADNLPLFPRFPQLREISRTIAIEVIKVAQEQKLAPKRSLEEVRKRIDDEMWDPHYPIYKR